MIMTMIIMMAMLMLMVMVMMMTMVTLVMVTTAKVFALTPDQATAALLTHQPPFHQIQIQIQILLPPPLPIHPLICQPHCIC